MADPPSGQYAELIYWSGSGWSLLLLLMCWSTCDSRDRRWPIRASENRSADQLSSADSTNPLFV